MRQGAVQIRNRADDSRNRADLQREDSAKPWTLRSLTMAKTNMPLDRRSPATVSPTVTVSRASMTRLCDPLTVGSL